jgi:hypothetical protein
MIRFGKMVVKSGDAGRDYGSQFCSAWSQHCDEVTLWSGG